MAVIKKSALAFMVSAILIMLVAFPVLAVQWDYEIVDDSSSSTGHYSSIALDDTGKPHISYYDGDSDDLEYASWTGSAWETQTVDEAGDVGKYSSLAIDASNRAHISYQDRDLHTLKYASWNGTAWNIETVDDSGGIVGSYCSLALDNSGYPHISYDFGSGGMKYAAWNGTAWNIETVDSTLYVGAGTSLALDSSENPHIAYRHQNAPNALRYIYWNGSSWTTPIVVDDVISVGDSLSLALDDDDKPHISYYDQGNENLRYAVDSNGDDDFLDAGEKVLVDEYETVGYDSSIAIDSNNHPHISYGSNHDLKYTHWTGSAWDTQSLATNNVGGNSTSIAVDASGYPHICYYDADDGDLEYARWTGSTWELLTIESASDVGDFSSIALDSNGYPHFSYYDSTNSALKYAHDKNQDDDFSDSGERVFLDSENVVGQYNSIAIDSYDKPHISYYDATNTNLKYAWNTGSWLNETVDSSASNGEHSSIALDSNDKPHISYYNDSSNSLKYASKTGASWAVETVDDSVCAGYYGTSIAVDYADNVHISYDDANSNALRYAHTNSPSWTIETLDDSDYRHLGGYSSIDIDLDNNPHISYYCNYIADPSNEGLKYMRLENPQQETPDLSFSPTNLTFTASTGGANPADQTLEIWNAGSGFLDWTVSDNASWLGRTAAFGQSTGEPDSLSISVDTTGLAANTYNAGLTIHNNAPGDNPTVLPVTLQVVDKPDLVITDKHEDWISIVAKSYNVTYTVKNQGTATANANETRVYIDAGRYDWRYVCPELAPGASYTNTVGPFTMVGDSDDILVYADPACSGVDESDEDNNYLNNTLTSPSASYNITLAAGWNLVSFPLIPTSSNITDVISDGNLASGDHTNITYVYCYNTTAAQWMWWNHSTASTLHTMKDGPGYWVFATVADTLTVRGTQAGHPGPNYPVFSGWDMIGFTSTSNMAPETYLASVDGNYTFLYCWFNGGWLWWMNGNTASTITNMEPGYGYWLYMNAGGIITPP